MRIKRIGLEHHGQPALGRRHRGRVLPVDPDLAAGHILKPRDQPQQGRLAAARRADEHREFAILDGQIERRNDLDRRQSFWRPCQA
jgi:hypothetical protein